MIFIFSVFEATNYSKHLFKMIYTVCFLYLNGIWCFLVFLWLKFWINASFTAARWWFTEEKLRFWLPNAMSLFYGLKMRKIRYSSFRAVSFTDFNSSTSHEATTRRQNYLRRFWASCWFLFHEDSCDYYRDMSRFWGSLTATVTQRQHQKMEMCSWNRNNVICFCFRPRKEWVEQTEQ